MLDTQNAFGFSRVAWPMQQLSSEGQLSKQDAWQKKEQVYIHYVFRAAPWLEVNYFCISLGAFPLPWFRCSKPGTPGRLIGEVWIADEMKLNFFQDCQLFQEDGINSSSRKRKLDVESNKPNVTQKVSLYVENLRALSICQNWPASLFPS